MATNPHAALLNQYPAFIDLNLPSHIHILYSQIRIQPLQIHIQPSPGQWLVANSKSAVTGCPSKMLSVLSLDSRFKIYFWALTREGRIDELG